MSKPRLFSHRWFLVKQIDTDFFWSTVFLVAMWSTMILGMCYAAWNFSQ